MIGLLPSVPTITTCWPDGAESVDDAWRGARDALDVGAQIVRRANDAGKSFPLT